MGYLQHGVYTECTLACQFEFNFGYTKSVSCNLQYALCYMTQASHSDNFIYLTCTCSTDFMNDLDINGRLSVFKQCFYMLNANDDFLSFNTIKITFQM